MRILVVEDEHRIAGAIKKGLEQERFIVDVVYRGDEGYDLAATEDYDLVILDIMLPGIDGIEISQKLRSHSIHVPILILTARDQVGDKVKGLNAGADDYLAKPFSFEELLARVRALLRRPKKTIDSVLVIGDLSLDTVTYQVRREAKLIMLSHREFSLLEYLMRNPTKIHTKEQIIHHVWDYDANILPNTVEVYIRNLRIKIDKPFERKPLIQTVRGFGYKISA